MSEQGTIDSGEAQDLAKILQKKYAADVASRKFEVELDADEHACYATVTLRSQDECFVYPVEGRLAFAEEGLTVRDATLLLVDYIDIYFDHYFREEALIPIDWTNFDFDGVKLQLRGQILNLAVEKMADEFLSRADSPTS